MIKELLQQLAQPQQGPCVTISLTTHRTHPDNQADPIHLRNLLKTATDRLLAVHDKRSIAPLLQHLEEIPGDMDHAYNTEGLYIFASNNRKEIVKTAWPPQQDEVEVDERFALRNLIKAYNRTAHYYILSLTQNGARLFEAEDNNLAAEITTEGFPSPENPLYEPDRLKRSEGKGDNLIKEYFNRIDKAVIRVHSTAPLPVIVATTRANYDDLLSVADKPSIYAAHITQDFGKEDSLQLINAAWEAVKDLQQQQRGRAIEDMLGAVSAGKVVTDIQEIWLAAHEGRGDLLLVKNDLAIPASVLRNGLELEENRETPGVTDDVVNDIAWEVLNKNGTVYFTDQPQLSVLGDIALKVRY